MMWTAHFNPFHIVIAGTLPHPSAKVWRGGPIMRGAVCETGFLYALASGVALLHEKAR